MKMIRNKIQIISQKATGNEYNANKRGRERISSEDTPIKQIQQKKKSIKN